MFGNTNSRPDEALRLQQIEEGRRLATDEVPARRTLHLAGKPPTTTGVRNRTAAPTNRTPLKGHEAFLKALELSNADVVLEKLSGVIYKGKLKHSDKFTLTLRVEKTSHVDFTGGHESAVTPADRVIFKHDISEFYTTTAPRVAPEHKSEEGQTV